MRKLLGTWVVAPAVILAVSLATVGVVAVPSEAGVLTAASARGSEWVGAGEIQSLAGTDRASQPPYPGTVWISPDVLTPASPSDLIAVRYTGSETRRLYDHNLGKEVQTSFFVYQASFACGVGNSEVLVAQSFSVEAAASQAEHFGRLLGQMPPGMRYGVSEVIVRSGDAPASAGYGAVNFYTDFLNTDWLRGFEEEVFLHEVAHATLDFGPWGGGVLQGSSWASAQAADVTYISDYASDFPETEDVAESYGAYAVWHVAKYDEGLLAEARLIGDAIPNRLALLDRLGKEFQPRTLDCPRVTPQPVSNLRAKTRGKFTTITWRPPQRGYGITHYEWRVGSRLDEMTSWAVFGNSSTSRLRVENFDRGNVWILEVRARWGSEPGPVSRVRFLS